MAVSGAPGSNLPGTMTSSAWAVAGSLIAGTILSIIIAAKAQDAPMAAHAWLFAFAFAAGVMVLGQRHLNATTHGGALEDDGTGYNDGVVKAGAIATLFWGVAGFLVGVVIAFQLAFPFLNLDTAFTNFGRLRPLHTSAVIFAFGGNALIATSFYVVQRTCRTRLAGDVAPWFVFWGYNLFIVVAATGYLMGRFPVPRTMPNPNGTPTSGSPSSGWSISLSSWSTSRQAQGAAYSTFANWFYLAFIVTIAMLHIGNNLAIPESLTSSKSYSLFPGVQDALIQWWYGHNAVGFFLTAGFLGMMYYFVPKRAERPVYSYRLSIVHFWSLIFLYIWAGPHHLHFTALPDWAQTLGMTFSIMLWMPSWGGMINGLMTLSGAWDKLRTDPVIRMLVVSVAFYGMSTFEGPVMSVKAVNSLSHYTDWTIGHVHSGALGWVGFVSFGAIYCLVPWLWKRERLYSMALVSWHFWIATIGIVLYITAMWVSGILQGLMWRAYDAQGFLEYSFAETVAAMHPFYVIRALGGVLFLVGALIMVYNCWMTIKGRVRESEPLPAPAPAGAMPQPAE